MHSEKESSLECLDNDHLLLVPRLFFLQLQQWHWPYVRARAHWILNMRLSSVWSSSIRISMMSKSLRPSDVAYFGGPRSRLSQKWDQNLCSFHSTGWFVDIYRHSMTLGKKMLPVKQGRGSYETGQPRSSTHCELNLAIFAAADFWITEASAIRGKKPEGNPSFHDK